METGSFVTVSLIEPKEKYWGELLGLTQAGVTIRGLEVENLEPFKYQLKSGDKNLPTQTLFFPMRRLERMSLDEAMNGLPSIIDMLEQATGLSKEAILK